MSGQNIQRSILCGLIGSGIQASRTPAMHEREGEEQGRRYVYRLIDIAALGLGVEALPELLTAAERMGFNGLNITYPFKQQIIPLLDELSDDARALNAVNTVVLRDGKRIGYNTDCSGWGEAFRRGLPDVARKHVVQLGAGGAGAAVAHAALSQKVGTLHIRDAEPARAVELAASLCERFGAGRALACEDLAAAMKQAYLHADPDFRFVEMRPRPIDLGIVDVANRTFESMGTWKTAVQWMLWLGFGTVLAAIFYLTR